MTVAFAPKDDVLQAGREAVTTQAPGRTALTVLLVALAYYVGADIGFGFRIGQVPTSIFWLPNATMFAVFLLVPPRRWWIYVLAAAPAHLAVQLDNSIPIPTALMLFATNIGDGALGAGAVRYFTGPCTRRFDGFRNTLLFLMSAIGAPLVVSLLDAGVLVGTGLGADYWLVWQTRFRSNVLTNIIWIPAVVITATRWKSWLAEVSLRRYLEAAWLIVLVLLTGFLVFGRPAVGSKAVTALLYLPLPLLLWAALRFGTGAVSVSLLFFAFMVIWNTANGRGPFAGYAPTSSIFALQVFLTLLSAPSLLLAALLQERRRAADTLAEREAEYRSIFESTSDGVLITDLHHGVVAANPAFCRLTGYDLAKLRATHPRRFFHLADLRPFDGYLEQASTSEETITQAMCVRADGGLSRFEIHGRRFSYGGLAHVLSVVREVTERERAYLELEQRVTERTRVMSTLLEISKTVASTLELGPVVRVVLEQLRTIVKYTGATILVRENDDGDLIILDHQGPLAPEVVATARVPAAKLAGCPTLTRGIPIVLDDLWGDSPAVKAYLAAIPAEVTELFDYTRAVLVVPLKARDRTIGVLRIDSDEPGQYTTQDAELAWALASQAAIAIENARLYDQARELAALEERQRLARELHDSVTQTLCAIAMLGKILPETWERDPADGRRNLANLDEMTQSALAEMRTLLLELRPDTLFEADLGDLLRQLAESLRSRMRAPVEVDVQADTGARLPSDVHVTLYRIAQEALSNVSKHAAAPCVRVALSYSHDRATLRISDDGAGFSPSDVPPGHVGTFIMHERAGAIGAALIIDSAPNQGTTVTLQWPNPERIVSSGP